MKILFISDTRNNLIPAGVQAVIKEQKPDFVITLGDVSLEDFRLLNRIDQLKGVPVGAILGESDNINIFDKLKELGITVFNLDKTSFNLGGVSCVAMSGAASPHPLAQKGIITDEESLKVLSKSPAADILITHDAMKQKFYGLSGITEYIKTKKPALHIHGHLKDQSIDKCENCVSMTVYRYLFIELVKDTNQLKYNVIKQEDLFQYGEKQNTQRETDLYDKHEPSFSERLYAPEQPKPVIAPEPEPEQQQTWAEKAWNKQRYGK